MGARIAVSSGTLFPPERARELGYVDRVVPPERLDEEAAREVERLLGLDAPSVAATKARMHAALRAEIEEALEVEWREVA